jgi:hypothetical protein
MHDHSGGSGIMEANEEVLTEHYRRAYPEALGVESR